MFSGLSFVSELQSGTYLGLDYRNGKSILFRSIKHHFVEDTEKGAVLGTAGLHGRAGI